MTPPATDRGLSEADRALIERVVLKRAVDWSDMGDEEPWEIKDSVLAALLAAARREGEGATETVAKFRRLLNPVWMALVERAMCGDPPADDHKLFTFMGSGASDMSTVGEFRELMGDERQAVAETEAAQYRGAGR